METKQKTPVEKLKDWADLLGFNNGNLQIIIGELEAAELYDSEENRKKDDSIDEILKRTADELGIHVDFSNKSYDGDLQPPLDRYSFIEYLCENFNRKKDEPKQSDVEEAAVDFCDKYDFNSCLTGTGVKTVKAVYDGFVAGAKWQSQQPVSIQWLSEEEIQKESNMGYENDTKGSLDFQLGMKAAQNELRSRVNAVDPVDLLNWITTFESHYEGDGGYPDKIRCFDAGWFWQSDRDGDMELTPKQIIEIYLTSKTK